jgi:glycosyltransferase involved in cell wall biosynthesis
MIKDLNLEGYVKFMGYVSEVKKLLMKYRDSDIFVFPSSGEGFPRVIYEAMSQGLPIVVSGIRSIKSVLDDKKHVLFTAVDSSSALADGIEIMAKDREMRRQVIKNSYKFVKGKFSKTAPEEQFKMLINKYINQKIF